MNMNMLADADAEAEADADADAEVDAIIINAILLFLFIDSSAKEKCCMCGRWVPQLKSKQNLKNDRRYKKTQNCVFVDFHKFHYFCKGPPLCFQWFLVGKHQLLYANNRSKRLFAKHHLTDARGGGYIETYGVYRIRAIGCMYKLLRMPMPMQMPMPMPMPMPIHVHT
jgi:hypothetical protein